MTPSQSLYARIALAEQHSRSAWLRSVLTAPAALLPGRFGIVSVVPITHRAGPAVITLGVPSWRAYHIFGDTTGQRGCHLVATCTYAFAGAALMRAEAAETLTVLAASALSQSPCAHNLLAPGIACLEPPFCHCGWINAKSRTYLIGTATVQR